MNVKYEKRLSELLDKDIAMAVRDGRIRAGQESYEPRVRLDGIPVKEGWEVPTSLGPAYFNLDDDQRLTCIIMIDSGSGVGGNGERQRSVRELDREYRRLKTELFRRPRYVHANTKQYRAHCEIPGLSSGGIGSSKLSEEDLKLSKKKNVRKKDLERIKKEENARRNSRKTD